MAGGYHRPSNRTLRRARPPSRPTCRRPARRQGRSGRVDRPPLRQSPQLAPQTLDPVRGPGGLRRSMAGEARPKNRRSDHVPIPPKPYGHLGRPRSLEPIGATTSGQAAKERAAVSCAMTTLGKSWPKSLAAMLIAGSRPTIGWYRRHRRLRVLHTSYPSEFPSAQSAETRTSPRCSSGCAGSRSCECHPTPGSAARTWAEVPRRCARPGPPALLGVKSPDRLTTTSGGFPIVEVRPAGEPARTSCSAQGLPSPELDPASPPVGVAVHRTTQRRRSQGTKPRA